MTSGSPLAAFAAGDGTSVFGQLDGQWQKGADISQAAVSHSGDLFLMSATNGSVAHWALGVDQEQWHFIEQIPTAL